MALLPIIHLDRQGSSGSGMGWDGTVYFRANLPVTIGVPPIGSIYLVENPTTILFGSYTTYQSGLYIKDADTGSLNDWRRLNVKVKFTDDLFAVVNAADNSKQAQFDVSLITTSTTRTYTWQNQNGTVALLTDIPTTLPPTAHASTHVNGTDDIQDATGSQKGLMTIAFASKLNGIQSGATANAKATASELNTGTDDAKFATALALEQSKYLNQSGSKVAAVASGTNTYTATIAPAITAYSNTQRFFIRFTNANTGAATINLNGLGAKTIFKGVSTNLVTGDILSGQIALIGYDGTNFQLLSAVGLPGTITSKLVLAGIITPAAPLAGTVNNYTATGIASSNVVRVVTNGANVLLTGIDATGIDNGQLLVVMNIDTVKRITLQDNDAGSGAANRFLLGSNIPVLAERSIALWYDAASVRWRKFNV